MRKRTMGIVQSLIDSFNHKNNSQLGNTNNNGPKSKNAAKVDEYEDVELIQMKMAIANDPNSFILNNLMMCIQFFENYEEDIIQIKETLVSTYESELNKVLPSQKHVLLPDILQERVSHNIAFTSKRQTGDLIIESLHPIRIYIVHDNIEITERHYLSEYSSLNNGITYNMMVQPSENPGYVRLRRLDETPYARNSCKEEDIDSSPTVDDDEIYDGDGESVYGRNSNMIHHTRVTPHHSRKRGLQTSSIFSVKSLPNLHDDKIIYEDRVSLSVKNTYETRSSCNFKTEPDFEHRSSTESRRNHGQKTWLKNELEARKESYQRYPQSGVAKQKVCRPASITSSGYRSEVCDSDSDWSYQPLSKSILQTTNVNHNENTADKSTKIYSDAMIPTQCFKKMRISNDGKIYILQRERKPQNCKQLRLILADRQYDSYVFYTSSKVFMSYFVDLFVDQLAEPLGFKREDLNHVEESIIHCDKVIDSYNLRLRRIESYEISPTIWLQWPEYAQEWLDRPRSTWPDYNDINKVKDFGCYVVPEDSLPRKRNLLPKESSWQQTTQNIHQEIEWQLTFPAAERYLETCMTRSQVQVYLIALMLHKTFLRQIQDSTTGLTTSHIRNKLFWLIEEDDRPFKWPDNRTGDCLIKLLDSLYRCLSQSEPTLLDYFLRDKNVFNKVPANLLLHSQKQLKRITENPVMYVFHAMENIKYSSKFFPRLNFTKLFNILTVKPWLAMNPALDMYLSPSKSDESYRDEIYNKSGGFWNKARKKNSRNYSASIAAPIAARKTLITPRKATDCIVEISERCAKLEGIRLAALLDFFVTHFIKMAECCHRYRAYQQKEVYLDQANRLSIILSEMTRYKDDAKAYRNKIYALRMKPTMNSTTRSQNEPPETPERNQKPIFSCTLKDRFTRQFDEVMKLPKDEQPQSSHQDHTNKITKTITSEIGLTNEGNVQANAASAITSEDEDPYTSRKPISKDQGDDSTSKTIQKVISLVDNLNETTFI